MKVTKLGTRHLKVWKGECHNCGSHLVAEPGEVKSVSTDPRDGVTIGHADCPVCGCDVAFLEEKKP